jgi:hypothetical protein
MALDVDPPAPPELSSAMEVDEYDDVDVQGEKYRRQELEELLREGAWEEAFTEWAADVDIDEAEYAIVRELGLFGEFDFFWDDFANRVGYHAPGIPEDWREREVHPDLDSWGTVSGINAGLTEFGQLVCEILKSEYIDWEAEYEAPDDLPEF